MSLKGRFRVGGKRTEHVSQGSGARPYCFQGPEVASGYRVGLDSRASGVHMVNILPPGGLDIATSVFPESVRGRDLLPKCDILVPFAAAQV